MVSTVSTYDRRPRALVIAEQANPRQVSVPLEGWSHARALAEVADVHLITQVRNREAILAEGLIEDQDFTAIDSEAVAARVYKIGRWLRGGAGKGWTTVMALNALAYPYFERLVWKRFGADLRAGRWDLVHRITPLSPTVPSSLAVRCRRAGVPFVLGPLNGGVPWPRQFDKARRAEKEWLSYVRSAHKLLPGYRATRRNAAAIIIGSRDTYQQMPARYHDKCVYIPENAVDPGRFSGHADGPVELPLRLAFLGRLVPYKGADMLIEAAAPLIRAGKVVVDIIGDGPEMGRLRQMVHDEGIEGGVKLDGWIEHGQVGQRLLESDVFAFPSIREFGGAVVLEAMALGLVPVIVDYGGPAELVTEQTGYTVPMATREGIIERMRRVLGGLVDNPQALRATGQRARQRVLDQFTWAAKARQTLEVWRWVLGERQKPDFGMPLREQVGAGLDGSEQKAAVR